MDRKCKRKTKTRWSVTEKSKVEVGRERIRTIKYAKYCLKENGKKSASA